MMRRRNPLKRNPLRNPGQSLDEELHRLLDGDFQSVLLIAVMLWALAMWEWLAWYANQPRLPWPLTILAVGATLVAAWRFFGVRRQVRNLKLGRDGEKIVAEYLDGLRVDGARIFHDIPGNGFNLDHVVISRHGILVVETKTLSKPLRGGKVTWGENGLLVDGRSLDRDPLKQVAGQAAWLRRLLAESTGKEMWVWGAVVFPEWWVERIPAEKRQGTWVLEPKALPKWLEREPQRLDAGDVALAAFHLGQYVRS